VNLHVEFQTPVLLLHGLVDLLGAENVLDYPPLMSARLPPDESRVDNQYLWGNGYTYARRLRRDFGGIAESPAQIASLIRAKAFDVVIFGTTRRALPFFYEVMSAYAGGDVGTWFTAQTSPTNSVVFIDADDAGGATPYAAVLASRAVFVERERDPGCPHRDLYYTEYGVTIMHHLQTFVDDMVAVAGPIPPDAHGRDLLTTGSLRTFVQDRVGFRFVRSGNETDNTQWQSTYGNRNIVAAWGEDLESAFVGKHGFPELGKKHDSLCGHLNVAAWSFRADLAPSIIRTVTPHWWEGNTSKSGLKELHGSNGKAGAEVENGVEDAWLSLAVAEALLLHDAAACPSVCSGTGLRYTCSTADLMGPMREVLDHVGQSLRSFHVIPIAPKLSRPGVTSTCSLPSLLLNSHPAPLLTYHRPLRQLLSLPPTTALCNRRESDGSCSTEHP